ncbi:murein transglycosylase A [Henriciella litoralis]|uniref:murein transglycosylase A n=1 Tax=Henriciella litoralis TaxID=568102 RepID=UPI0009FCB6DF|nr:MltA domain-containing protein [Henriciella litoralis]
MRRLIPLMAAAVLLAACSTTPDKPAEDGGVETAASKPFFARHKGAHRVMIDEPPQDNGTLGEPETQHPPENYKPPVPAAFAALPGWDEAQLVPAVSAMRKSCLKFKEGAADAPLSGSAPWAGSVLDWMPACEALDVVRDEDSARAVIHALFRPVEIESPDGESRFTGYFEPVYEARMQPEGDFTEPVPGVPSDLIAESSSKVYQRLSNGSRRPYPTRAEITKAGVRALAYAHPGDVFFLQIQGSGKLHFPDGSVRKASFAAHNAQPFKSTANWLLKRGWITRGQSNMQGIRDWMDRATDAQVREAMNANPRFVFFNLEPADDESGPVGAMGVPLTPFGSIAIDRSYNPMGVPVFVQTSAPGLGGDWSGLLIAQDTGGAIKGPVRGDIYFGTGYEAGQRAGTMNAPGRMWVLLPRAVADRMGGVEAFAGLGAEPVAP